MFVVIFKHQVKNFWCIYQLRRMVNGIILSFCTFNIDKILSYSPYLSMLFRALVCKEETVLFRFACHFSIWSRCRSFFLSFSVIGNPLVECALLATEFAGVVISSWSLLLLTDLGVWQFSLGMAVAISMGFSAIVAFFVFSVPKSMMRRSSMTPFFCFFLEGSACFTAVQYLWWGWDSSRTLRRSCAGEGARL